MQQSPEIRELVMRALQLMAAKNAAAIMESCSREPGVLFIGTAPSEWMTSLATLEPVVRASLEGGSGRTPDDVEIQAYQEGSVGWAGYRYSVRLPNGASFPLRWSAIFHQEGGTWKLVHSHASVAIPDEQVMSIAQPAL